MINSVIGAGVTVGKGSVVRDFHPLRDALPGDNCTIDKGIIAEDVVIGDHVSMGVGEFAPSVLNPKFMPSIL